MYQFAAAQQASTPKLAPFFQKLQKTVRVLRLNETEVTLRNVFIDNVFALDSEEKIKK